jgi:two-component sensor histidine kinase
MATLADIARQHTALEKADVVHLQRLVADWGLLADFCFADLLLHAESGGVPAGAGGPAGAGMHVVLAQVRPVTSQTLYPVDWVGAVVDASTRPVVAEAFATGQICEGEAVAPSGRERVRITAIPVHREGRTVAVLSREWAPGVGRQPGELERTYLDIFHRFARMIAAGEFPFSAEKRRVDLSPRVGDGVVVLDASERVEYASPNAVSALHRCGISTNAIGQRLAELGFDDATVRQAFDAMNPVLTEYDAGDDTVLVLRCLPLLSQGKVTGGVLLLRDVSELRRRDRMLLSKDATIREIHHRVKNNLQTISSLLRLQGRRLQSPEAKQAIDESVRRIRAIALVHETLSREAGDDVAFVDIVRPLARMAEEGLQSPDRPVRFRVIGDGGSMPASVATPLAVVLTELLQNAVDHAFPHDRVPSDVRGAGAVVVVLETDGEDLRVAVVDNGVGMPEPGSGERSGSLGLSIVRTLVTTELAGRLVSRVPSAEDLADAGLAAAQLAGPGTVVELTIPVAKLAAERR